MNNKIIRTLYKNQLLLCNKFGYNYGEWINIYEYNNFKFIMSDKKRRKFITRMNKEKYAKLIANCIRYEYKLYKDILDEDEKNELIDYSFYIYRNMKNILKKKY